MASEFPGNIDIVVFFLDDGIVGGESAAVSWFCRSLGEEFARVGLTMNPSKCVASPSAGQS